MDGMKPKLTLRDLFWLMLVAGLALGWWRDHRSNAESVSQIGQILRFMADSKGRILTVDDKEMWIDLENGGISGFRDRTSP
jgi:hypothetical protein